MVKEAVDAAHARMEAKQRFDAQRRAGWTAGSKPTDESALGHDVYEGDDARVREFLEATDTSRIHGRVVVPGHGRWPPR